MGQHGDHNNSQGWSPKGSRKGLGEVQSAGRDDAAPYSAARQGRQACSEGGCQEGLIRSISFTSRAFRQSTLGTADRAVILH